MDWFARSMGSSLEVIPVVDLLVEIIAKESPLYELSCCDALNTMIHGDDGTEGHEFTYKMDYYLEAYELYLVYKKYNLYKKGDYSFVYDLYYGAMVNFTRGQLKVLVYLNGGLPPSKRFNRKIDWALAFMETPRDNRFSTFGIKYTDVRTSIKTYTADELRALVFKNHGTPPRTDGKLYWAIAYLNTRRYGFNTFGLRSSLNSDMLSVIREFL